MFVNLEQMGDGGATLQPPYLELLRNNMVVDYARANALVYARDPEAVPVIHFGHAPYLQAAALQAAL